MSAETNQDRACRAWQRFQETGKLTHLEEAKDALVAVGWLRVTVLPNGEKRYEHVNEARVRWLLGDPNDS